MNVNIEPYKAHYIAKVLPLVYDDTLSHLESISKLSFKLNEVIQRVNNLSDDIINEVNAYTDKKVSETFAEIDKAVSEIYALKNELDAQYKEFEKLTNSQLQLFNQRLLDVHTRIDQTIPAINERTDLAISQNNNYIMTELGKSLSKIKVINYFTGGSISVQDMFDYLAVLHAENALTYEYLIGKAITYDELISKNVTYTDFVLHGKILI